MTLTRKGTPCLRNMASSAVAIWPQRPAAVFLTALIVALPAI